MALNLVFIYADADVWLLEFFLCLIPIVLGYAEIHYRLPLIPSLLYQPKPEILADIPYRVEPGHPLPVYILAKDAHRFPAVLERAVLKIWNESGHQFESELIRDSIPLTTSWWEYLHHVSLPDSFCGHLKAAVEFVVRYGKKRSKFYNHNYRRLSFKPFQIYASEENLPATGSMLWGDLHVHSSYTCDQVEFGASLPALRAAASALGLQFLAITDHSYDLDDHHHNFLRNHRELPKWKKLIKEIENLNRNRQGTDPILLLGEEVSARNSKGETVHFLVINSKRFFAGSGDSAEHYVRKRTEWSIHEILDALPAESIGIAAHPGVIPPRLEQILLKRGSYQENDLVHENLSGLQILNGVRNDSFEQAKNQWISLLLKGYRRFIYAGSDAHGNFNGYRQIRLPFFSLHESRHHLLGQKRTGVFLHSGLISPTALVDALRSGCCFISEGPAMDLCLALNDTCYRMGETAPRTNLIISMKANSTAEFGALHDIRIIWGDFAKKKEFVIYRFRTRLVYEFEKLVDFHPRSDGYIRIEIESRKENDSFKAYSNPIWVRKG